MTLYPRHRRRSAEADPRARRPVVGGAVGKGGWIEDDLQPAYSLDRIRSEEHTSELQSLTGISYAVFCLRSEERRVGKEC